MTDFLIKSTISLFVLLALYHLVLEKEKMHQSNRFYLLFSLVFWLVIPFVTIEVVEEVTKPMLQNNALQINQGSVVFVEKTNYLPIVFWTIYGLITFLLSIRFTVNISKILNRIKSKTIIDYKNAKLVLLEEKVLPHTFLNFIFINEVDYNNRKIETELFSHELTHVTHKHTLDVLFIEILKTVFWFNPIFIFYKKAIQLNHEFMADEKVVTIYNNVSFYQNLLISKSNNNPTYLLTSNLNYSLTKKRLLMMTKTTSRTKAIFNQIFLIPFIFGLVFLLCFKTVAQEKITNLDNTNPKSGQIINESRDAYYDGVQFKINDVKRNVTINKKYEELTSEEKDRYIAFVPKPFIEKSPTKKELEDFKDSKKYAIWVDGVHKPNDYLNNFEPNDIAFFQGSSVSKNARSKKFPQPFQYNFYTHNYFDKNLKNSHKKFSGKNIEIRLSNDKNSNPIKDTKDKELVEKKSSSQITEKTLPEYLGGMQEFYNFFSANYKIPSDFKGNGKIYISFMVETDGSISDFEVLRDSGFGTGEEAVRVLKLTPKWIPGKEDGKVVRMKFTLPIAIQAKK